MRPFENHLDSRVVYPSSQEITFKVYTPKIAFNFSKLRGFTLHNQGSNILACAEQRQDI
jgi:hypothetical protein